MKTQYEAFRLGYKANMDRLGVPRNEMKGETLFMFSLGFRHSIPILHKYRNGIKSHSICSIRCHFLCPHSNLFHPIPFHSLLTPLSQCLYPHVTLILLGCDNAYWLSNYLLLACTQSCVESLTSVTRYFGSADCICYN